MSIHPCALFLAAALSPAMASAMPPEAAAVFEKAGVRLTDADLYRVAEVYNYWRQRGESIWPGVDMATVPVQFVFPEKLDVLIGHPSPPLDCVQEDIQLPAFGKTFCHRPDRTFLNGAMTGKVGNGLAVSFNTMDVFDDYVNDYFLKNNIKQEKFAKPYLQYLGELAHEMMHAHQAFEARHLPKKERGREGPKLNKADYPYQDEENCLLLGLEGRILADLLEEESSLRAVDLWRDFLLVRSRRHRRLPKDIVNVERYMELSEGTAQYVGWSVQHGDNRGMVPLPETAADPRFPGYVSSGSLRGALLPLLKTLEDPKQGRMMPYVYWTGTGMAATLDKASPGWKRGLFRSASGLSSGLFDLLGASIKPAGEAKQRFAAIEARYGADELRRKVREALDKDLAENKSKLEKFFAAPGKRVSLVFHGLKPEEIMVVAPGMLTEVGKLRVYEAGVNKILCRLGRRNETRMDFSKVLPVLLDRETGRLELALPEGDALSIQAEKTSSKAGTTVYKGGVELKSPVFGWKGKKLVVSEEGGRATLTFFL